MTTPTLPPPGPRRPTVSAHLAFALKLALAASAATVLFACGADDEEVEALVMEPDVRAFNRVDEELWPYFTRYEDEASARGIAISLADSGVSGRIVDLPHENVAGECSFTTPRALRVDAEIWADVPELVREYIVFHELGHCDRLREHREDRDANGYCVSVMASGAAGADGCNERYNGRTREELLDELFDLTFYNDRSE